MTGPGNLASAPDRIIAEPAPNFNNSEKPHIWSQNGVSDFRAQWRLECRQAISGANYPSQNVFKKLAVFVRCNSGQVWAGPRNLTSCVGEVVHQPEWRFADALWPSCCTILQTAPRQFNFVRQMTRTSSSWQRALSLPCCGWPLWKSRANRNSGE